MRRQLGLSLCIAGGAMLLTAAGRYAVGTIKADSAREQWDLGEARSAVAMARSLALHHGERGPILAGAPVARIEIPRIGLDAIVIEGVDDDALNAGPGHLPGSAFPGEPGNAVISAHRDRHFRHLDQVGVGDTLTTESGAHRTRWVVTSKRIIAKNNPALFTTDDATLTLTTCWPLRYVGTAPDRLIVTAKPMGVRR